MNSLHADRNNIALMNDPRIFTVSEINESIRGILEVQFPFISVAGEISNLRQPLSGHCYFTLKDEKAQIRAVLFKMQQRYLSSLPADGQMVICRGRISVYEQRGEYQLIVDTMDFHGTGMMQLKFEKLKQKLAAQGLFEQEAKKQLPFLPEHITIVTSPKGAAVHDFIRIAQARCPLTQIDVFPVSVQGKSAAGEIADAIKSINQQVTTDIIVLCRGGGSLEDLWAFNEEKTARAIFESTIPVVSAVGHEIDFTIADFVADLRSPTPSAAAEMILPEVLNLRSQVLELQERQFRTINSLLQKLCDRVALNMHKLTTVRHPLDNLSMKLDHATGEFNNSFKALLIRKEHDLEKSAQRIQQQNPLHRLQLQKQKLADLYRRLFTAAKNSIESSNSTLSHIAGLLDAVSPLSTLARGYAIVKTPPPGEEIITDSNQIAVGSRITVTLHKGILKCIIEETDENLFEEED